MDESGEWIEDLITQATCAVLIDGEVKGTAWLVSQEGYLLTAGHLLKSRSGEVLDKVEVRFDEDLTFGAEKIVQGYDMDHGIDFAVLKIGHESNRIDRTPMPISLTKAANGPLRLKGYGKTLKFCSTGLGTFSGSYDPLNNRKCRLFLLESTQLGEQGYSGGAVFSDTLQAAVAIQTAATNEKSVKRAGRNTVIAMPLYRVAEYWDPLHQLARTGKGIRKDIGEIRIDASSFYGREKELSELEQWLTTERCRLVAIMGVGGIGKSHLAAKLLERVEDRYDKIIWKDLINTPSIEKILQDCIKLASDQECTVFSDDLDEKIALLLKYLQKRRCLIVFDNVESILSEGQRGGECKEGYQGYGRLIKALGETTHQSSLLLTSRGEIQEFSQLEGSGRKVRSLDLKGLDQSSLRQILLDKHETISGNDEDWKRLTENYGGNPAWLNLEAPMIHRTFGGSIADFLRRGERSKNLRESFNKIFKPLADEEKDLMYWLAISREHTGLDDLERWIFSRNQLRQLPDLLSSLIQRSLINKIGQTFVMIPVYMEHMIEMLVDRVAEEITGATAGLRLLNSYSLMIAQAKDYLRVTQKSLILTPILDQLSLHFGELGVEAKLKQILADARATGRRPAGYLAGNIINLLTSRGSNLTGQDFSNLAIWQAYLQGVELHDVNLANSDLKGSVFTETFGNILSVVFSHDNRLLAASSATGKIYLWKTETWELVMTCAGHSSWVRSVSFNADDSLFVSSADDRTIKIWATRDGSCLRTLDGHDNWIRQALFSPDGNFIASFSDDLTIRIWDANSGACLRAIDGHDKPVNAGIFQFDGQTLASASSDHTIKLWDVRTGQCRGTLLEHTDRIWAVAISPDGQTLASGGEDQTIRLWDLKTGTQVQKLEPPDDASADWVRSLSFSPRRPMIASGGENRSVRLWHLADEGRYDTRLGHTRRVRSVSFSPDGELIASGGDDQTVRVWDAQTDQCTRVLNGYTNRIWSSAFSADGANFATGSDDGAVRLWDTQTRQCLQTLHGHEHWVWSVVFSPDAGLVASCGDDLTVRIWNAKTYQLVKTLRGHKRRVRSVVFDPTGNLLASGSEDHTLKLWRVQTGECLKTLRHDSGRVHSVAFNPSGTILATSGDDKTIKLWDAASGDQLGTLKGHENWVWGIAFSPDGRTLASASDDRTVRLWNVGAREVIQVLNEHQSGVLSVAFRPDGAALAAGSEDGTIRIWDLSNYQSLGVLTGHTNWVWAVGFAPDGRILLSSGEDETVRLWDLTGLGLLQTLRIKRPYESMNISKVSGITDAQKDMLKALGAIEYPV